MKAEKVWNKKSSMEQTWGKFKAYWKEEIRQWDVLYKGAKQANQVVLTQVDALTEQMSKLQSDMSVLQANNQSYKEANNTLLACQVQFHQALQVEQMQQDNTSTLTDYMAGFKQEMTDRINSSLCACRSNSSGGQSVAGTSVTSTFQRYECPNT